jgi:hypothetical protein
MPLPHHVAVEVLWHNCSDAMLRRYVGSSGAESLTSKSVLLASNRPSDRLTLCLDQGVRSSGAEGIVLARLCMNSNWVSDRPTGSPLRPSDHPVLLPSSSDATKNGPSVHPTVPRVWPCVPTHPTIAPTLVFEGPSVHPTVSSLLLFLLGFDPLFWHFCMWFSCILGT